VVRRQAVDVSPGAKYLLENFKESRSSG